GRAHAARPPTHRGDRTRAPARQAHLPAGGLRAAAAHLHAAPAATAGRGAFGRPPPQAELPATCRGRWAGGGHGTAAAQRRPARRAVPLPAGGPAGTSPAGRRDPLDARLTRAPRWRRGERRVAERGCRAILSPAYTRPEYN